MISGILSNHLKYQKNRGQINFKAQSDNLSLTFSNAADTIVRGANSFITDGFEVGDRIYTNSANAGNKGPFIVKAVVALTLTVMNLDGTSPTLVDGTENNLTVGTYIIGVRLMRSGFVFNKDDHATLTNIKAVTGAFTPSFVAATKKITRGSGSFITDGFVPGNKITVANSASNNGAKTIVSVVALEIVVSEALVDETGSGDETLTADDELATGNGYTQGAKLTGPITMTEDDTNDRSENTFPTVTWAASGGSIGPTPSALLINRATTDNTIIGCIDFGGEQTATTGTNFNIAGGTLRNI